MSETSPTKIVSELLGAPAEELMASALSVKWDCGYLSVISNKMRGRNPGLIIFADGWAEAIKGNLRRQYGHTPLTLRAQAGFFTGNLMTYQLLDTVAAKQGEIVPDPDFGPENAIDTVAPVEKAEWLLDLCLRGMHLPEYGPVFDAISEMLARSTGDTAEAIKKSLYAPPVYDERSFDIIHYLAGAAEIVLPVERQARLLKLEPQLE